MTKEWSKKVIVSSLTISKAQSDEDKKELGAMQGEVV